MEIIRSIKNKIEWVEREEGNLSKREKENITRNLKEIEDELERCIILHMAINRQ